LNQRLYVHAWIKEKIRENSKLTKSYQLTLVLGLTGREVQRYFQVSKSYPENFLLELANIYQVFSERVACFMFQNSYFEILAAISNPLNNFKVSIKKKKKI
jgi:hypothetical protein